MGVPRWSEVAMRIVSFDILMYLEVLRAKLQTPFAGKQEGGLSSRVSLGDKGGKTFFHSRFFPFF